MHYLDFRQQLSHLIVFSLRDIRILEPNFSAVQLSQWQKKGYIKKLIKGKYIFSDLQVNEHVLFLVANELLSPSYISMEMALSWYRLIPEGVFTVTSVSTVRTCTYETRIGNFNYKKIKESAFFGDKLVQVPGTAREYRIATIEKAIVDYLYFKDDIDSSDAIEGLRLNPETMRTDVNYENLVMYAEAMSNKNLLKRVSILVNYFQK